MATDHCPHCNTLLPATETAAKFCPSCGKTLSGGTIVEAVTGNKPGEIPTLKEYVEPPREREPRQRRSSGRECPECGSPYLRPGPWPWYLGTVGAMLCSAKVCEECGHGFDAKKPQANLAKRKRNLALIINGIGLLGILTVVGALALWFWYILVIHK
jgi:hypothetical protein